MPFETWPQQSLFGINFQNSNEDITQFRGDYDISQFFERHGAKVRKIYNFPFNRRNIELISKFCSTDQLKTIECVCESNSVQYEIPIIEFPLHFHQIEQFKFRYHVVYVNEPKLRLPMLFSESLQYLVLKNIDLLPRFDWTELMHLTKLYMYNVREFNIQNFIEFIRRRPKLKHFYLYSPLDDSIGEEIGEALGKYCGDQIEYFTYHNNNNRGTRNEIFYNFLSE